MELVHRKHRVPYPRFFFFTLNCSRVLVSQQLHWLPTSPLCNWVVGNTLCSSLFIPRSSHFSREPWFLLLERGVRNQGWGAGYTGCQCLSFLLDHLWWQIKEIYTGTLTHVWSFPCGSDGKIICLQCGRPGFHPWVGKILWKRKWQPTPVLLLGKSMDSRTGLSDFTLVILQPMCMYICINISICIYVGLNMSS